MSPSRPQELLSYCPPTNQIRIEAKWLIIYLQRINPFRMEALSVCMVQVTTYVLCASWRTNNSSRWTESRLQLQHPERLRWRVWQQPKRPQTGGKGGKSVNLIKFDQFFDFSPKWTWGPLDRLKILSWSPLRFSTIENSILRTFTFSSFLDPNRPLAHFSLSPGHPGGPGQAGA